MSAFDPVFQAIAAEQTGARCFVILNNEERFYLLKKEVACYTDLYRAGASAVKTAVGTTLALLIPAVCAYTDLGKQIDAFLAIPDNKELMTLTLTTAVTAGVVAGAARGIAKWNSLWEERRVAGFLRAQDVRPIAACVGLPALTEDDLKERPKIAFLPTRPWNSPTNGHDFAIRRRPNF